MTSVEPLTTPQNDQLAAGILKLVMNLAYAALGNFFQQQGFVPLGADRLLGSLKRRTFLRSKQLLSPILQHEAEEAAKRILRQINPDWLNEPEFIRSVASIIREVDLLFFPILDTIYYPAGSKASLMMSILSMIQDRPSGDPEADAELVKELTEAYYNAFYHDADIRNMEFMRRTWGAPAGELGNYALSLYKMGILDPRTQTLEEQIEILKRFVPAAQAVRAHHQEMGMNVSGSEAIKLAAEINALLPPGQRNPENLTRMVISLTEWQKRMLQHVMTGKPGGLQPDEAVKAHLSLIKAAKESHAASLFGAIVKAKLNGWVKPGSIADQAADAILEGRVPDIFKSNTPTTDLVFSILVRSGCSENLAGMLAFSPALGRSMVGGGMSDSVTLAVRQAQGYEILNRYAYMRRNLLRSMRGRPVEEIETASENLLLTYLNSLGYPSLAVFEQLHKFDVPVQEHIRNVEELMFSYPSNPSANFFNLLFSSLGYAKNIIEVIAGAFGLVPGEHVQQRGAKSEPQPKPQPKPEQPPKPKDDKTTMTFGSDRLKSLVFSQRPSEIKIKNLIDFPQTPETEASNKKSLTEILFSWSPYFRKANA